MARRAEPDATAANARRGQGGRHRRLFCLVAFFTLIALVGGCLTVDPWEDARIERGQGSPGSGKDREPDSPRRREQGSDGLPQRHRRIRG